MPAVLAVMPLGYWVSKIHVQANSVVGEVTVSTSIAASDRDPDDLTRSFMRLSNLPTYPLDRLSRYEVTLWRQACHILFALQLLARRKPWERMRGRI